MRVVLSAFVMSTIAWAFPLAAPAHACGPTEAPCTVPLGTYHVALPATPPADARGHPAVVYYHGAGGSGAGAFKNTGFTETLLARGYAVIAPNGMQRPNSRFGPGWFFRPESPGLRDELAFTREFLADATTRFPINRDRIMLTGFSIGGSLVWYLACRDATLAAAYAPVAGGFWRPHPAGCNGSIKLLHTHGWRDQTVPLEGRPLRSGRIYQGDIFEGLQVWRAENGCTRLRPDEFDTDGSFWRRIWTACHEGTALELALHPGGHSAPGKDWVEMAVPWFESVVAEPAGQ